MSTYTKRRHNPHRQYDSAGIKDSNDIHSPAQQSVVPGRRAGGEDQPFLSKPVSLRRPNNPKTQDSPDVYNFERMAITKQPTGPFSTQEHHSHGGEVAEYYHPRKVSHRLTKGELQMSRAIHEKKLMLQKKLWRVEERVREKIHKANNDAAEGEDHDRGQTEMQKRREPARDIQGMRQERSKEDVQQLTRRQDKRMIERTRHTHEEDQEVENEQLKRKAGILQNKSRWENVKEHTRGKGVVERGDLWGQTGGRSIHSAEKRDHTTTYNENKYRNGMSKVTHSSRNPQHNPQTSQHKTVQRSAPQYHSDEDVSGESLLPAVCNSSQSSGSEKADLGLTDSSGVNRQLLPCRICNRKFTIERLEKHTSICEKFKNSHRQVFNSFASRTKGSDLGEYLKTHSCSRTPEILKSKQKRSTVNARNPPGGRLPAPTPQTKRFK